MELFGNRRANGTILLLQLVVALFAFSQIQPHPVAALENGLGRTPPMGWLAWERFTCQIDCVSQPDDCISARLFELMAERLVLDGYQAAGYEYVNIDDCWSEMQRDPESERLVANQSRFAGGIGQLAAKMHARNLKLGLYGDCGTKTCAGYPAQLKPNGRDLTRDNYFQVDAQALADWQVDSFKFDGCFIDPLLSESVCPLMSDALASGSRPMILICEWPFYMMYAHAQVNYTLVADKCNVWRYYDDVFDSWESVLGIIDYSIKIQSTIVRYHGPGHWFDPDQLVIGNFGLSPEEERAQMAIWALWSAPLYMSNDLRKISAESAALLKNRHLISVNQDPLGIWGLMVAESPTGNLQAFVKPILPVRNGCPSFFVVFFNRNTLGNQVKMSFKLGDLLNKAPIYVAAERTADGPSAFDAGACTERLYSATNPKSRKQIVEFELTDSLDDGASIGRITPQANLELLVPPSGVRAVRLEQPTEEPQV